MTKTAGLGDAFYLDGTDLSGDVGALDTIGGGNSSLVVTGINKSAQERIGGKRDGRIGFSSFFNPANAHLKLNDLPTGDVIATYFRGGVTAGNHTASCVAKQVNYDPARGNDGSLVFAIDAESNGFGVEWGTVLAFVFLGSAGNTAGVDFAASSAFGLQAYAHVTAFTGTSATFTIQESSDDAAGDPYAAVTGGAFAAFTAPGAQRIGTANNLTVERWLRVAVTGTFSALAGAVVVNRNPIAGVVF